VRDRTRVEGYANVEVILAGPDDPLLPLSGIDLLFSSNTYHFLENRGSYLANAGKYVRPGGRIAIIDFGSRQWVDLFGSHYTPADLVKSEMKKAGYALEQEFDILPRQHFLIFGKTPA